MAKHMNEADRRRIELLLGLRWTITEIAKDRGRPESTIAREILNRRIVSTRGYGCTNRICANYDACTLVKGYGLDYKRQRRNSSKCFETCPDFKPVSCDRLGSSPYVCNGCERFHACPLKKRLYVGSSAQANYVGVLKESRSGIRMDDESIAKANEILSPGILRRQSVRHVVASHADVFKGLSERTVYDYIAAGLFDAKASDLPEAGRRKPGRKPVTTKTNARNRVNRTYAEFVLYREANPDLAVVEMDTVIGQVGGKVLFTFQFTDCGLMLAFLREARTAQTCTRIVNELWNAAGPDLFRTLFAIILTDNGPEFSDPDAIELYRPAPVHNPTKRLPRGIRLFYCDPYCSSQKPHVENNHRMVRRILEHGTSFNMLTQEDIDIVMSNVNSYTRGRRPDGSATVPYDEFVRIHGDKGREFLAKLGIVRVPSDKVTLDPILLGRKFKAHAEKVILDRYGVKKGDIVPEKK